MGASRPYGRVGCCTLHWSSVKTDSPSRLSVRNIQKWGCEIYRAFAYSAHRPRRLNKPAPVGSGQQLKLLPFGAPYPCASKLARGPYCGSAVHFQSISDNFSGFTILVGTKCVKKSQICQKVPTRMRKYKV